METTKSVDGTVIAYDRTGDGPPLIVAVGAFCDRRSFVPPSNLTSRFTVYTYDRRGRGDSGDKQPYSPDREVADLAAMAAVASAGSGVFAFGHSSGGALVLRAAAAGLPLTAVASYRGALRHRRQPAGGAEPGGPDPRDGRVRAPGRAVRYWMTEVVRAPTGVVRMMEGTPIWPGLEALTHTLPYDLALSGDQGVPAWLSAIAIPVLVLGGSTSPDWFHRTVQETAAVISGARMVMMEGYDHGVPPEVIAPVLTDFFLGAAARVPGA